MGHEARSPDRPSEPTRSPSRLKWLVAPLAILGAIGIGINARESASDRTNALNEGASLDCASPRDSWRSSCLQSRSAAGPTRSSAEWVDVPETTGTVDETKRRSSSVRSPAKDEAAAKPNVPATPRERVAEAPAEPPKAPRAATTNDSVVARRSALAESPRIPERRRAAEPEVSIADVDRPTRAKAQPRVVEREAPAPARPARLARREQLAKARPAPVTRVAEPRRTRVVATRTKEVPARLARNRIARGPVLEVARAPASPFPAEFVQALRHYNAAFSAYPGPPPARTGW